jgi:hypothetical protein
MNIEVAKRILTVGKRLAPDRFPQPALEIAETWELALATVNLPPQVWEDAVLLWCTELVGDKMCTPRDMIGAARTVRDRWESDPQRRQILEAHRVECQNRNYARAGLEPIGVTGLPNHSPSPRQALTDAASGQDTPSQSHRRRTVERFAGGQGQIPA